MAYALDEQAKRALARRREEIDKTFGEHVEAHPELADYGGRKGCPTWAYDNWEDDPA